VVDGGIKVGDYTVPVPREWLAKAAGEDKLTIGIRPENFAISDSDVGIGLDVAVVEELGADAFLYGTLAGLPEDERLTAQQVVARISSRVPPQRGSTVRLTADAEHFHVFSTKTGDRLS
jgi:multiple sugar transport system ATP-binding protein